VGEKAAEQARVLVQRLPGDLKNDPSQLNAVVLGAGPIGLLGAMKLVDGKFNTWVYSLDKADSPNVRIVSAIGARFISSPERPPADLTKIIGNISLVYEVDCEEKKSLSCRLTDLIHCFRIFKCLDPACFRLFGAQGCIRCIFLDTFL
jgi:hypothetical protein